MPRTATRRQVDKAFDALGASAARDQGSSRHPAVHRTHTVDYAIVLSGEIWAVMDVGETLMQAGDCFILVGAQPLPR